MDAEWAFVQEKGVMAPVTEMPKEKRGLPMKPFYKIKRDALGQVDKYKTRMVVLGCLQRKGMDFEEVFVPNAQQATFRVMVAHAVEHDFEPHQFDVVTAFLSGELDPEDDFYVRLPEAVGGQTYRLRKALYGLKQAARAWHAKLLSEPNVLGYTTSEADPCICYKHMGQQRGTSLPSVSLISVGACLRCPPLAHPCHGSERPHGIGPCCSLARHPWHEAASIAYASITHQAML